MQQIKLHRGIPSHSGYLLIEQILKLLITSNPHQMHCCGDGLITSHLSGLHIHLEYLIKIKGESSLSLSCLVVPYTLTIEIQFPPIFHSVLIIIPWTIYGSSPGIFSHKSANFPCRILVISYPPPCRRAAKTHFQSTGCLKFKRI